MCVGFWLFLVFLFVFFVCFCMIWSYIIIFSPPEHRKHHLNLKWGDLIFWFRPLSCTHDVTPWHIFVTFSNFLHLFWKIPLSIKRVYSQVQIFLLSFHGETWKEIVFMYLLIFCFSSSSNSETSHLWCCAGFQVQMETNLSLWATKDGKARQSASSVSETQSLSFYSIFL